MKKFYFILLMLPLSLMSLLSCSDSNDDRDYVSLVTVIQNEAGMKLLMKSDSTLMNPTNVTISSNVGQRVLVEYEITKTNETKDPYRYEIKIEDFDIILTKSVIDLTAANEAEVGNDPFYGIFEMNSGGNYLNVYMSFLYNYTPHLINLVANKITPPTDDTPALVHLELRQNANGANTGFIVNELVSFNVQKYIDAAKAANVSELVLVVKVLLFDNVTSTYNVKFKIGDINSEPNYNTLGVYKPQEGATK
ncbi:MAG: NigD-like C-terminal domain-containing protein [Rikenellaceae bacterium]